MASQINKDHRSDNLGRQWWISLACKVTDYKIGAAGMELKFLTVKAQALR